MCNELQLVRTRRRAQVNEMNRGAILAPRYSTVQELLVRQTGDGLSGEQDERRPGWRG